MEMCSPLTYGYAAGGATTPSALQLFGGAHQQRGFVRWGTPGSAGAAAPAGRVHEWWQAPSAAGASGWTPVAAATAMRSAHHGTPPFLRDKLTSDYTDAEDDSASARWADVSSASTQVFYSADGGSEFERVLLFGCEPLSAEELDARCVSAALALALVRSSPPSPLVLSQPARAAKGAAAPAKNAALAVPLRAVTKPKAAVPSPAQPAAPPAVHSKRKRAAAAAAEPPPVEEAEAEGAPNKSGRRSAPGVCGWTAEEDSALLQLVLVYGEHDWVGVSQALGCGRSGKQARERYVYIKPGLDRGPWSEEEECTMMEHHARLGNRWAEIARIMRRPENMVKNRFYSRHKAALKAGVAVATAVPAIEEGPGAVM